MHKHAGRVAPTAASRRLMRSISSSRFFTSSSSRLTSRDRIAVRWTNESMYRRMENESFAASHSHRSSAIWWTKARHSKLTVIDVNDTAGK